MNNHLMLLIFLSSSLSSLKVAGGEFSAPETDSLQITKQYIFFDHRWHELEVELSNGDALTYTIFTQGPLAQSSHCIYAQKVDESHERRYNASADWTSKMHDIYSEMIGLKQKSYAQ